MALDDFEKGKLEEVHLAIARNELIGDDPELLIFILRKVAKCRDREIDEAEFNCRMKSSHLPEETGDKVVGLSLAGLTELTQLSVSQGFVLSEKQGVDHRLRSMMRVADIDPGLRQAAMDVLTQLDLLRMERAHALNHFRFAE